VTRCDKQISVNAVWLPAKAGGARVMTTWPGFSMRKVCRVLHFSRARLRARAVLAKLPPRLDEVLVERLRRLIERHPTFGYRRLWALLRFGEGIRVNRKAIYRVLKLKNWFVYQRVATPRPPSRAAGAVRNKAMSAGPWTSPTCRVAPTAGVT
jgi:hypothetical protein